MSHELNLARKPFLNPRPVLRVTILLWVVGAAVAAFNVNLYLSHYSGSGEVRERLQELQASLQRERREVANLETELARFDVTRQNEQSVFLNAKIAERSFPWSSLFDQIGEVLPADLRLTSLSPSFESDSRSGKSEMRENEVLLGLRGSAKSSEVLLEFIDALFSHPSFRQPNLSGEALNDSQLVEFSLSVIYEARRSGAEAELEAEAATEAGADSGAAMDAGIPPEAAASAGEETPAPVSREGDSG